jgi:RNA polymerase sigma-70 factor (ECF subfamily)
MTAFNKIYSDHYDKVFSWCKFKIGNHEAAEELASDVFVKVHKHLTEYDENKSSIGTWVMNITKNAIIDYWRTNKQNMVDSISDMTDDEGNETFVHTDYSTPETALQNSELGSAIHEAIQSLPQNYATIADMFFIKELSHDEISTTLNSPLGTVKVGIHRAKEMLRSKLMNL